MIPVFDLDAYFDRIRYSGGRSPTLETLRNIQVHHTETIPFENLNPLLGWAARDRRYALLNNEFAVHYLNGCTERRVLTTAAEMREILQGPIGLTLPAGPELDNALHLLSVSSNA